MSGRVRQFMNDWRKPGFAILVAALIGALLAAAPGSPAAAAVDSQQAYVKASNTGEDLFGHSVAIDGDTMVVGAPQEDSSATGVDGDQTDDSATDSGAAYVFTRSGGTWSQQAYLKSSDTDPGDLFGFSVAVAGDTVVVGSIGEDSNATGVDGDSTDDSATNSGAAYVFTRSGGTWSQQAYLKPSSTDNGDFFGASVGISDDTVVVGAYFEDSAATGVDGNDADNSATNSGAAYVFTRSGSAWSQQAYLKASNTGNADDFGFSVAIEGDTVVVGSIGEDSDATGVNGNQLDNSTINGGAAYVFARSGSTWSQQAYLKASNTDASDIFGNSVAVDGDTVVVGAPNEDSGATGVDGNQADNSATESGGGYVFTRSGGSWSQQAYVKASNTDADDSFGVSVEVLGDTAVFGAHRESSNSTGINGNEGDNSASNSGAAYVLTRSGNTWSQQNYLKASNTDTGDVFGFSVATSGDTVVVGADGERSNATGVDGNQADNSIANAGAAYVFVETSTFTTGPTATISGTVRQGETLTAEEGAPVPVPDSFTYEWLADGVAIGGATAKTFELTSAEVGKKISVTVTAKKAGLTDASDTSAETAAVVGVFTPGPAASISGYPRIGSALIAHVGPVSPSPDSFVYRWYANGRLLSTKARYLKLTTAHYGKRIQVKVWAVKAGYLTASSLSAPTTPINNLQAKTISMELNDYTVWRRQRVYAEIERLAPREPFSIVLDGKKLASGKANTRGVAVVGFTIPSNATTGARIIRAYGQFPDRTDPDRITIR